MIRNREQLLWAGLSGLVTLGAAVFCFALDIRAGWICLTACFCLCALTFVLTRWRYRRIAKLNAYLQKLSRGEYTLPISDNKEGELSILENEIYKAVAALTEQSAALRSDKQKLALALTDISHQLKTPLTALGVMAELLENDALSPAKRREFLALFRADLSRMEWLVLTLLKLARLDADAADMKTETVLLSQLVEKALSPMQITIEVKEIALTVQGEDQTVTCDPNWTAEALGNILKNAVEYTQSEIVIEYGKNPLYTFITVHDNGPGLEAETLPHIWQRFYRGRNASPNSAGIGLAMSRTVLQKQNGDIEAENRAGALFSLKFYDESLDGLQSVHHIV